MIESAVVTDATLKKSHHEFHLGSNIQLVRKRAEAVVSDIDITQILHTLT